MDELAEVKRQIREAEGDLRRAKKRNDRELELKVNDRLNLLLREKERLVTAGEFKTPSPRRLKSPHRDSTKQRNMRGKVMERNRNFYYPGGDHPNCYKCDICQRETDRPSDYINSHIIAHAHARALKLARTGSEGSKRLPTSPSYICNGLFLCRNCDKHFEDHIVTIAGDGVIAVNDRKLRATKDYKKLHKKKVVWANEIDRNVDWPTSATLDFRNTLAPVLGDHRKLEFGVDDDDKSTASEVDDDEEMAASSRITRKRARKVPDVPTVRGKRARKVA